MPIEQREKDDWNITCEAFVNWFSPIFKVHLLADSYQHMNRKLTYQQVNLFHPLILSSFTEKNLSFSSLMWPPLKLIYWEWKTLWLVCHSNSILPLMLISGAKLSTGLIRGYNINLFFFFVQPLRPHANFSPSLFFLADEMCCFFFRFAQLPFPACFKPSCCALHPQLQFAETDHYPVAV